MFRYYKAFFFVVNFFLKKARQGKKEDKKILDIGYNNESLFPQL